MRPHAGTPWEEAPGTLLETFQMATQGQVLCQGLTQGLTSLGFPWLSQAEQWHVPHGTWQTRVPCGSCYIEYYSTSVAGSQDEPTPPLIIR